MSRLLQCAVAMAVALWAVTASAGANDEVVRGLVQATFAAEYKQGKLAEALANLEAAKVGCEGDACSKAVRAELWIAIGMCLARQGKAAEAQKAFGTALKLDGSARPVKEHSTPEIEAAFGKAKGKRAERRREGCRGSFKGGSRKGRGWREAEAYHCYLQALQAERDQAARTCIADARASIEIEDRLESRSALARCLERDNQWQEAIFEWEEVSKKAAASRVFAVARRAAGRAAQLGRRLPVLIIQPPTGAKDLVVKLDGAPIPLEVLDQEMTVNPGKHTIAAQGVRDGLPLTFEQEVDLAPSKTLTVPIRLAPGPPKWATRRELKCMLGAQTPEAFAKCLGERGSKTSDLAIRVGTEVSGYTDTTHVDVLTPHASTSVEHVTGGWGIGASFLVDVVTAASPDIVATASPRFQEVRWAPSLSGHKKLGDLDVSLGGSLSHEPDYIAASLGANAALELRQKTLAPSLGYEYSHDVNGRVDTSFSVFSRLIDRHAISAGLGLVLTKATFGSVNMTLVFEDGDASKPYRHVPMFDASQIPQIPRGLKIDAVNLIRLPERPLEQLPNTRRRFALAFSLAHRFTSSTLRASERLYVDSWGTKASTTDARFMYDLMDDLRVWPHLRFHAQTAAAFYELAYVAETTPAGIKLPVIRTGDRELGPLVGLTLGGGLRYDFGERKSWGATFVGDVIYTKFLDHLFIKDRFGYFGALGLEVEIE